MSFRTRFGWASVRDSLVLLVLCVGFPFVLFANLSAVLAGRTSLLA